MDKRICYYCKQEAQEKYFRWKNLYSSQDASCCRLCFSGTHSFDCIFYLPAKTQEDKSTRDALWRIRQ